MLRVIFESFRYLLLLQSLSNMVEDFSHKGQKLVFFNATDEIQKVSRKSGYKNLQFCAFNQNLDDLLFGKSVGI